MSGVSIRVEKNERTEETRRPVSELDHVWWVCVIRVLEVLKGTVTGRKRGGAAEVVTLFAHSTDIVWYQSPKFSERYEGVWLLHRTDSRGNPVPDLVSDNPLDFHRLSELDRIRALLERLQP